MGKKASDLRAFAHVDGPIECRNIIRDVEKDGMRIVCNRCCPDNVKCGTVVYNCRNKLKDVDQDECTVRIVALEAESTLNHFVRKSNMPPESSSCYVEGANTYHCDEWHMWNKVCNGSFRIDTRIWFELYHKKIQAHGTSFC
jgi:hypothetical protein